MNMIRMGRVGRLVLGLLLGVSSEAAETIATPSVGGVKGGGGTGLLRLTPFLDLAGTYDSNVNQVPDRASSDYFLDSTVGLKGAYSGSKLDVSAMGFLSLRNYASNSDMNFSSGGESFQLGYGARETLRFGADQSYRRTEDVSAYGTPNSVAGVSPDVPLAVMRSRHDDIQFGGTVGRDLTDKLQLDLGYHYSAQNYLGSNDLNNVAGHVGQLDVAYAMTDKTAATLTAQYGHQEVGGANGSSLDSIIARIGAKTRSTEKLTFHAGVGPGYYDRGGTNGSQTVFNYDVGAIWQATEKISFFVNGGNGVQVSALYGDNTVKYYSVAAGTAWRFTSALSLTLSGSYRVDDYQDPIVLPDRTTGSREDKGTGISARLAYQPTVQYLSLYGEANYSKTDSNISSYDETRISVGANLKY